MGLRSWLVNLIAEAQLRAMSPEQEHEMTRAVLTEAEKVLAEMRVAPPPPSPEGSWSSWSQEMRHLAVPGWAPCRFANRLGPTENIGWVFGIAQGDFGIWRSPYHVCVYEEEEERRHVRLILSAITHLPTGMGVGLFNAPEVACEAVGVIKDLEEWRAAPVLGPDQEPSAHPRWIELMNKATATWAFNGILMAHNMHAHQGYDRGERIAVFSKIHNDPFAGKPEHVS